MKQILLLILFANLFIITIQAQRKPIKKPIAQPTPQKVQEVTTEKAVTEKGKAVVLKSNGTWEFASVEVSEPPKTKSCELTLKDAPVVRGLKLGMSKSEVETLFTVRGNDKNAFYFASDDSLPNDVKRYTFYISSYALSVPSEFWNMRTLILEFFNDELHSIVAKYSESAADFTNEQFRLKISQSFNLPVESWVKTPNKDRTIEQLKCEEFEVQVDLGSYLTVTNLLTSRKIEESEKRKRERFKP